MARVPIRMGEAGPYKTLCEGRQGVPGLSRDHIPAVYTLILRADDLATRAGINLTPTQKENRNSRIQNDAWAIVIPDSIHKLAETTGGSLESKHSDDLRDTVRNICAQYRIYIHDGVAPADKAAIDKGLDELQAYSDYLDDGPSCSGFNNWLKWENEKAQKGPATDDDEIAEAVARARALVANR